MVTRSRQAGHSLPARPAHAVGALACLAAFSAAVVSLVPPGERRGLDIVGHDPGSALSSGLLPDPPTVERAGQDLNPRDPDSTATAGTGTGSIAVPRIRPFARPAIHDSLPPRDVISLAPKHSPPA